LREWAEELLSERSLREDGLLHGRAVRTAWETHLSGSRNLQYQLWGVLMFLQWRRRWPLAA
jgi:asparagine synthase (glutamine-hydrolysing)